MYVLILMVIVFMACWFPLSAVNLFRDLGMRFDLFQSVYKVLVMDQMYFKLLNVHVIAMTSIVWNPVLYFWMSKVFEHLGSSPTSESIPTSSLNNRFRFQRHRRALKDDMTWLTNARRHTNVGVLSRFTPSPSVSVVYRRTLERHLGVNHFR